MRPLLSLALMLPLLIVVLPVALYLTLLTVAAPFGLRRPARRPGPVRRFAVLIPAHNEEAVLGRLLASLHDLAYPKNLFDVHVVADNCTDATVMVGRTRGAYVHERTDTELPGKGHALQWLLSLAAQSKLYDAYVVIDADSVVSPNFLNAMNERLDGGALVVQAYYTVLPLHRNHTESLREAALALVHYLRPAAKTALHASSGLKGNGMCFHHQVIERFGWPTAGLAEDVEFHLTLVRAGIPVTFAPEAVVRAEMPATLRGSRTQNMRRQAGRLATVRAQALPLLRLGLRRRDVAAVDAAVEQFVPPLSVPVALDVSVLGAGLALGLRPVWVPAGGVLALFALHILAGLMLARVPARVYGALLHAPIYMAWKVWLFARALAGRGDRRWVRTERANT